MSWGRLGGSTTAGVAGVEVIGSGAIGGGGEDVCGAGGVAVSSARLPRTSVMTSEAVSTACGGADVVTTAGVATSDTGVMAGGFEVVETTRVAYVVAGGGVDAAVVDAGVAEAETASYWASTRAWICALMVGLASRVARSNPSARPGSEERRVGKECRL